MSEDGPHLGAKAGESIATSPQSGPSRTEPIFKAAAWILGGFSLLTAGLGALTVVPRIANGYLAWTVVAVALIMVAFLAAMIAVGVSYQQAYLTDTKWWRDWVKVPIALAAVSLLTGIAIVLVISLFVLGRSEVPRLTLSLAQENGADGKPTNTDAMKLKFEADSMNPGGFMVVNVIGLKQIEEGADSQHGDRLYLSVVGADSAGRIVSEVNTEIPKDYDVVVVEVFPGPIDRTKTDPLTGKDLTWAADQKPSTTMCADISNRDPRACVYARVPD
jgi:hypothetical protein